MSWLGVARMLACICLHDWLEGFVSDTSEHVHRVSAWYRFRVGFESSDSETSTCCWWQSFLLRSRQVRISIGTCIESCFCRVFLHTSRSLALDLLAVDCGLVCCCFFLPDPHLQTSYLGCLSGSSSRDLWSTLVIALLVQSNYKLMAHQLHDRWAVVRTFLRCLVSRLSTFPPKKPQMLTINKGYFEKLSLIF